MLSVRMVDDRNWLMRDIVLYRQRKFEIKKLDRQTRRMGEYLNEKEWKGMSNVEILCGIVSSSCGEEKTLVVR